MPCGLDDAGNTVVLQRRRGRELLREQWLVAMLLICVYTSVGGRCGGTTRLTVWFDRLIEQDKVLLLRGQIQVLKVQLMRGWCRQAWGAGGEPW